MNNIPAPGIKSVHINRYALLLIIFIVALPLADLLIYTWITAAPMISRDQWHFLPMVQGYFEGHFKAFLIWRAHAQHRIPAYKILFLLDAIYLKLNMRFEIFLGICLLIIQIMLLMKRFLDTLPTNSIRIAVFFGLLSIGFIGFNLNQWASLIYALTAFSGNGAVLFFLCVWLVLDTQLRQGTNAWKTAGLCLLLSFALLAFGSGMGPAFTASILLTPIGIFILQRTINKQNMWLLGWVFVISLICELIYWLTPGFNYILIPSSHSFFYILINEPLLIAKYILLSLASGTIFSSYMAIKLPLYGNDINLIFGAGIFCLYVISIYLFVKLRMWKATYVPAFLIAYSVFFIISILIARLPHFGIDNSESTRYVLHIQLGYIGCIWILFYKLCVSSEDKAKTKHKIQNAIPALLFLLITLLEGVNYYYVWNYQSEMAYATSLGIYQVRTGDFRKRSWVCHQRPLCTRGRAILMKYGLNIFANNPVSEK